MLHLQHPAHRERSGGERRKGIHQTANLHPCWRAQPKIRLVHAKVGSRRCGVRTHSAVCPLLRTEGGTAPALTQSPALSLHPPPVSQVESVPCSFHYISPPVSQVESVVSDTSGVWKHLVPSLNLSSRPLSSWDGTHWVGEHPQVFSAHVFSDHTHPFSRKKIKLLDSRRKADKGLPARNADSCLF